MPRNEPARPIDTCADERLETRAPERTESVPRVVFTEAPIMLARVTRIDDGGIFVKVGSGSECEAMIDRSVDPALVARAQQTGARVVIEHGHPLMIVGLLTTERALTVDRHGDIDARVRNFSLSAAGHVLMKTPLSFLQMDTEGQIEMFGQKLLSRARKVAKILAAHISLN